MACRKRAFPDRFLCDSNALQRGTGIYVQRVVLRSCREYLPSGGQATIPELNPVFADSLPIWFA
jgi:hypothetical protein